MELLVLSPMSANQDIILNIIAILTSPKNVTLISQSELLWSVLLEVICVKALCLSPKEVTYLE